MTLVLLIPLGALKKELKMILFEEVEVLPRAQSKFHLNKAGVERTSTIFTFCSAVIT